MYLIKEHYGLYKIVYNLVLANIIINIIFTNGHVA